jgi:general secretion pathway protein F/type IV pilus assembly protein PilC
MAIYQYVAKTAGGEEVAGVLQAESEAAAVRALDERRLFPVRVAEQKAATGGGGPIGRIRAHDVGIMYGQLSDLLAADVPALRALDILQRSLVNKRLAALVGKVREDVAAGKSLADAMAAYPAVFTPLHAAMIRAGERAGFLEEVLTNLAAFIERQDELKNKVLGATIYPVVVVSVGVGVALLVMLYLVPQFKTVFEGMPTPTPTRILFGVSDLVLSIWPLVLMALAVVVAGIVGFFRSEVGRRWWDRWRLRLPVVGKATRLVAITRFCRILGMMLTNGVPLLQALDIAKDATGSFVLSDSIAAAAENVRAGETLAEPLGAGGFFPVEVVEMIAVAEESNRLEKTLLQISDTVERRTNRQVDLAMRLMEPAVLVILAAGIGGFALALIYPIFTMVGSMGAH